MSEQDEITTALLIQLSHPERDALRRFLATLPVGTSEAQAARVLVKDGLVGMGDLAISEGTRG